MDGKIAAMILAGGKGTRLGGLTRKQAKPALAFGGKYRIIDFALSNCANSGIAYVGVCTQYENSVLNSYIGNGSNWGLNGVNALTSVLTPKQTEETSAWYRGTADAIYQNIDWLDSISPELVLILSGDHIYFTSYESAIAQHRASGADCTLFVHEVPLSDASRFGIVEANDKDEVIDFKEKPRSPKSNLASMGIYIFNYKTLRRYLVADADKNESSHDFGKDIIPGMLSKGKKIKVFRFDGYWKDVGTLASLHQANMDLLPRGSVPVADVLKLDSNIYSEDNHLPPQYIGPKAVVRGSLVNQGSVIKGLVDHCVVSSGALVEEGAECHNAVLMAGCHIHSEAKVYDCIVSPGEIVHKGEVVNAEREGIALLYKGKVQR